MKRARGSSQGQPFEAGDGKSGVEEAVDLLIAAYKAQDFEEVIRIGVEAQQKQKGAAPLPTPFHSAEGEKHSTFDEALSVLKHTIIACQVAAVSLGAVESTEIASINSGK